MYLFLTVFCLLFYFFYRFFFLFFFFFFQAEDGIRDRNVTGVQTCALPIFSEAHDSRYAGWFPAWPDIKRRLRSEERRVGKSVDLGGRRIIKKKKNKDRIKTSMRVNMNMVLVRM